MSQEIIFAAAMGLVDPWYIVKVEFKPGKAKLSSGRLDIYIDFKVGSKFKDPASSVLCGVHDTVERKWRHANFFQHECYVHAFVPRIKKSDGSVQQVQVPWAMEGSSFTLLFEALGMLLVQEGMSLSGAGRMVNEDSRVIGRIIGRYVDQALEEQPLQQAEVLGIDEVSTQKGHHYLTILSDSKRKKIVGVGVGKCKDAVLEGLLVSPGIIEVYFERLFGHKLLGSIKLKKEYEYFKFWEYYFQLALQPYGLYPILVKAIYIALREIGPHSLLATTKTI